MAADKVADAERGRSATKLSYRSKKSALYVGRLFPAYNRLRTYAPAENRGGETDDIDKGRKCAVRYQKEYDSGEGVLYAQARRRHARAPSNNPISFSCLGSRLYRMPFGPAVFSVQNNHRKHQCILLEHGAAS